MHVVFAGVISAPRTKKRTKGSKCSFCSLNTSHLVTWCPKKDNHKVNTSDAPFQEHNMNIEGGQTPRITAMETTLTMSKLYSKLPTEIYGSLEFSRYKLSFILKEA